MPESAPKLEVLSDVVPVLLDSAPTTDEIVSACPLELVGNEEPFEPFTKPEFISLLLELDID